MPTLGYAIANYLSGLKGQYSVELPEALHGEMNDIVIACNAKTGTANRALLVIDDVTPQPNITTVSWAEKLKWRTDDDRIFVLPRGEQEPDTSFRSVVRPFISNYFPGDNGGECTTELLAQLTVEELWNRHNFPTIGDSFNAFNRTFKWVADVLRRSFEQAGSTPSAHWSDQFLIHWADMMEYLDISLGNLNGMPVPRHAWEIIRVAGLPVPSGIIEESGNPFLNAPEERDQENYWATFAQQWQNIADKYLRTEGDVAVLLTALDTQVPGAGNTSPWRDLKWDMVSSLAPDVAAPILGKVIFTELPSPSLLSSQIPSYPLAPSGSWWGVTDKNLRNAIDQLHQATKLEPSPSCNTFVSVPTGQPNTYLLETRNGLPTQGHTPKKWIIRVALNDLHLIYRANWKNLKISSLQPSTGNESDAWIKQDDVKLKLSPGPSDLDITFKNISTDASGRLAIHCDAVLNCTAAIDATTNTARGSWNPVRTLRLEAKVSYYLNGNWTAPRSLDSAMTIVIPSPFSPTIIVEKTGKIIPIPRKEDTFATTLNAGNIWKPEATLDLLLPEEGTYNVGAYDGRLEPDSGQFMPILNFQINGQNISSLMKRMPPCDLDNGDVLTGIDPKGTYDIAVVKIMERSGSLSSGLLSAVRGVSAKRGRPSQKARNSVLGQYQEKVTQALRLKSNNVLDSLYQYIISSTEAVADWPPHQGTPSPQWLFDHQGLFLPGIGNEPSAAFTRCKEWTLFMAALADVCDAIGLISGPQEMWLSSFDPSVISPITVRKYVEAHRDLVKAAKRTSTLSDIFWASYPFSIMVVDGKPGASLGQLLAVLLSPLHPARLAWAFSVALTAREGRIRRDLLGLAEGWNIPCTGCSINAAGQQVTLVAIPTDPGSEQDFAAWGALAVLTHTGLAELPAFAAGLPLPWAGQTGINDKVVERAITDYLNVHPYLNSLEVDIRSVSPAPRSKEIDEAVLLNLGTQTLEGIKKLGGNTRVWDSSYRLGSAPTRDDLFAVRKDKDHNGSFEWKAYSPSHIPEADVALIENSSVHLTITSNGTTQGIMPVLPLRRFCPSVLNGLVFDQNYAANSRDDILGLTSLLEEIEFYPAGSFPALRATPQATGLGIGLGARWEVMGTFNIDPALLASIVISGAQATGNRLVWEWRPSWLIRGREARGELAQRPYYVIAKIPASLLRALTSRLGIRISEAQAIEMLAELGHRGIGLNSLQAAGGTQASAAAGFFYTLRVLFPYKGHPLRASWSASNPATFFLPIPVDPIEPLLASLAGDELSRRADLLVIRVVHSSTTHTNICFAPIEVKHHGRASRTEPLPDENDPELRRAREQLNKTVAVLQQIIAGLYPSRSETKELIGCYMRRLGLATLIDLAMSLAPLPPSATQRAEIIRNILSGNTEIGIGNPALFWFAPGLLSTSYSACIVNPYASSTNSISDLQEIFIDPDAVPGLWWSGTAIKPDEQVVRTNVDDVMKKAFSLCATTTNNAAIDIRTELERALGLDTMPPTEVEQEPAKDEDKDNKSSTEISSEAYIGVINEEENMIPEGDGKMKQEHKEEKERGNESHIEDSSEKKNSSDHSPATTQLLPTPERHHRQELLEVPRAFLGWSSPTSRWTLIGKLSGSSENVALDLDHPKTIGIFGYMGSGKSYLLGALLEAAVASLPGINQLPSPLAAVIFNYRRNASDRFELASLTSPNSNEKDVERLISNYHSLPQPINDVHVLALPGELTPSRLQEYSSLSASELFFDPDGLSVEDWELLMGEPASGAVFARTIRHALVDLRAEGKITLERLEERVFNLLGKQSRMAAQLRFDFIRRYLSTSQGIKFEQVLKPGRVVIVDLRQPLFNKEDAIRFFLVCANHISQVQGTFNKLIIFDEAHEYLSDEFSEKIEARIRQMRHEGTSYLFATQDVGSIPLAIRRFITTRFVFSLGTRENVDDLVRFAPEFRASQLLDMQPGYCLVQANQSVHNLFGHPRIVQVRPRVTQHGGASRIFSQATLWDI